MFPRVEDITPYEPPVVYQPPVVEDLESTCPSSDGEYDVDKENEADMSEFQLKQGILKNLPGLYQHIKGIKESKTGDLDEIRLNTYGRQNHTGKIIRYYKQLEKNVPKENENDDDFEMEMEDNQAHKTLYLKIQF